MDALYDDAIRELLGFPSAGLGAGIECLFRPTFHFEGALFVSMGDGGEGELVVRVAAQSIFSHVSSVARAEASDLAAIEPPEVATERARLDERSSASLRERVAAAMGEPEPATSQRGGRDGMAVDVILRDGATTRCRLLVTTDGGGEALGALLRSAVDLAIGLTARTPVEEHLRTIRRYLADR